MGIRYQTFFEFFQTDCIHWLLVALHSLLAVQLLLITYLLELDCLLYFRIPFLIDSSIDRHITILDDIVQQTTLISSV